MIWSLGAFRVFFVIPDPSVRLRTMDKGRSLIFSIISPHFCALAAIRTSFSRFRRDQDDNRNIIELTFPDFCSLAAIRTSFALLRMTNWFSFLWSLPHFRTLTAVGTSFSRFRRDQDDNRNIIELTFPNFCSLAAIRTYINILTTF